MSEHLDFSSDGLETIRDFLRWTYSRFNQAELFYGHGSDNAWDETVHLVLQSLHLPWDTDQSLYDSRLTASEKTALTRLVERRILEREPVAYLLNQAWFCGMPFYVDQRVLVPRSPIAELINNGFEPWLSNTEVNRVMDLCTGSGCIGIACAEAFPQASVDLLDISPDALEVSRINIDRFELWERVQAVQSDLFKALDEQAEKPKYQLIVSNPPYVDAEDMADMPEEFQHEPELGLTAGDDGLDCAREILARAADFLDESGLLVLEVGNSWFALEEAFPEVPFTWVEFEHGGHGVLAMTAEDCRRYQAVFAAA
ncbi:50S ribosomal protein L3 N(5)-glutamine methyltransferase [Spongorhabdus nitratireducens]